MNLTGIGEEIKSMLTGGESAPSKEESKKDELEEETTNEEEAGEEEKVSEGEEGEGEGEESEDEDAGGEEGEEGSQDAEEAGEEGDEETGEEGSEELSELEAMRKQNELLMKKIDKLTAERESEEEEAPKVDIEAADFLDSDESLDLFTQNKEKANEVLNKVVAQTAEVTIEHVYKRIPEIITKIVRDEVNMYRMADEFFTLNRDLLPHRGVVRLVFDEMVADNPDEAPKDIFKRLAKESRMYLRKEKPAEGENKKKKKRRPHLPAGGSGAARGRQPEKPKGIAQEINDMKRL